MCTNFGCRAFVPEGPPPAAAAAAAAVAAVVDVSPLVTVTPAPRPVPAAAATLRPTAPPRIPSPVPRPKLAPAANGARPPPAAGVTGTVHDAQMWQAYKAQSAQESDLIIPTKVKRTIFSHSICQLVGPTSGGDRLFVLMFCCPSQFSCPKECPG